MSDENKEKVSKYWHASSDNQRESYLKRDRQLIDVKKYVKNDDEVEKTVVRDTWLMRAAIIGFAAIMVLCIALIASGYIVNSIIIFVTALVFSISAYLLLFKHRAMVLKYSIVSQTINRYFNHTSYFATKDVPEESINDAEIVEDWEVATSSDYFSGTWKNYKFDFGDLTLRGRINGVNGKVFTGQFYIIKLPEPVKVPILIREREELLTPESYEAHRTSERFFITGNERFDRQFEVRFGSSKRAAGFEDTHNGLHPDEQRKYVHSVIDPMTTDIITADSYASSRTLMRFKEDRLYIAIENTRDTFEFRRGDERSIKLLRERFDDEARAMTSYLDMVTQGLNHIREIG